ncbi:MAG: lysostaphin resistance A-like protein [Blastocatellia bacterium]
MNSTELFINPQTGQLRSGWRAAIFVALLYLPRVILDLLLPPRPAGAAAGFEVSVEMALTYVALIVWVMAVSWFCLRFLERLKLSSLGFALHSGWSRDVLKGCAMGATMIAAVVAIQIIGGGTWVTVNSLWWRESGFDWTSASAVFSEVALALVVLILAGAFEELVYRGYAFQTLLRELPEFAPILLFSIIFGLAHWNNPNRTFFSTTNTVLAGIWLSMAYLRTRSLWFPTALHFTWNWMMGAFFGLPVSGLRIPEHPILVSTSGEPLWLTGGSYGSEGGAAATIVLVIAIVAVQRARWLSLSPEMGEARSAHTPSGEPPIRLGLEREDR